MEKIAKQGEGDLDEDQKNDDCFKTPCVLRIEFCGENFEELMDDIEAFIEDFNPFGHIEIMCGASIVRFELGMFPEKFRGIEDFAVEIDEVAFNENFSHFSGNFFPRKSNFSIFSKI